VRLLALFLAALPLGHSVEGRTIQPVVLGSPSAPHRLLVVGCIHGDECAGLAIVRRLVAAGAPAGAGIVVVSNLNPDGFAAGTRRNARGVDLNRDFYARTQPETRFAVSLIRRVRPEVTVWFHQPQGLVRAWGPSVSTARRFAALAGVSYRSLAWPPGSASNWQNHAFPGTASFVVELPAGPVRPARAARWVRALRALAVEGVRG
jgi:murein peptide amidase A